MESSPLVKVKYIEEVLFIYHIYVCLEPLVEL